MKTYYLFLLGLLIFVTSCSKKNEDTGGGGNFSQEIKNLVPQNVIDSMRKWGLIINEGKTPPVITGIYNFSPNLCTFDNSGYNLTGSYFSDYRFRLHDQNNSSLTIALDYKALSAADTASGAGSFISGAGNGFTVFVEVKGVSEGVPYTAITFYSGTKTATGVQNFQLGYYLKDKGPDPSNVMIDAGSSRVFKDEDGFSDINSTFRTMPSTKAVLGH